MQTPWHCQKHTIKGIVSPYKWLITNYANGTWLTSQSVLDGVECLLRQIMQATALALDASTLVWSMEE